MLVALVYRSSPARNVFQRICHAGMCRGWHTGTSDLGTQSLGTLSRVGWPESDSVSHVGWPERLCTRDTAVRPLNPVFGFGTREPGVGVLHPR